MIRPLIFLGLGLPLLAEPVPVILDTDMAGDCDDAGALATLHALADLGEAEILAVVTNRKCPANASAAGVSAINNFYGRPHIPVGTDKDGSKSRNPRPSPFTPALRDNFPHHAMPDSEMPDALAVYRDALASAPEKSVVICSVGALSNLEDLLRSRPDDRSPLDGAELIRAKVKNTVIMGGGFPRTANPETNIKLDPAAAVTVVNEWPGPLLFTGFEVGKQIRCGGELKSTPETNPVRRAFELRPYLDGFAIDAGKPAYDQTAVLLAVRGPQPELWQLVGKGRVVFDSDGHCEWRRDWPKKHAHVKVKGDPARLTRIIEDLMKAPPKASKP